MTLQNRVTPEGEIVAVAARGDMMGNRGGAFHDRTRQLGRRRWASAQWICCVLAFKGRRRTVMQPGRYTELFFLDEATALAAGHRPCFECRRHDAIRFAELWARRLGADGRAAAGEMDKVLHRERLGAAGVKRTHVMDWGSLPCGTFVRLPDGPALLAGTQVLAWSPSGYSGARPRPRSGEVVVLTPPTTIGVLREGYRPGLHASARLAV